MQDERPSRRRASRSAGCQAALACLMNKERRSTHSTKRPPRLVARPHRCGGDPMIIVAGQLTVAPDDRGDYLKGTVAVIAAAREAPGCLDFTLSADPLDEARINVFELWQSDEALRAFRGSGPSSAQLA